MSVQALELRRILERRFPGALPLGHGTVGAVATGVEALDRALPGGGLPRGKLTSWAPGGGASALARGACLAVVGRGERAAWVDAGGRVGGGASWPAGLFLLRPGRGPGGLACAEELLRCGGFGLVVLALAAAASAADDHAFVRLSRAVREGGGAFIVLGAASPSAALRLETWTEAGGYRWRRGPFGEPVAAESVRVRAAARALGWSRQTEFWIPVVHHELRLSLDAGLVDRRGAGP